MLNRAIHRANHMQWIHLNTCNGETSALSTGHRSTCLMYNNAKDSIFEVRIIYLHFLLSDLFTFSLWYSEYNRNPQIRTLPQLLYYVYLKEISKMMMILLLCFKVKSLVIIFSFQQIFLFIIFCLLSIFLLFLLDHYTFVHTQINITNNNWRLWSAGDNDRRSNMLLLQCCALLKFHVVDGQSMCDYM